jgi:hypothetical protein
LSGLGASVLAGGALGGIASALTNGGTYSTTAQFRTVQLHYSKCSNSWGAYLMPSDPQFT